MMLKPFRNREMPVIRKFGKMTWGSEIQKYQLVTKPLIYKENLFRFEDVLRLHDSTSNISINNLIYIHVLHKKWSDFIKYHCLCWKDKIWIIHQNLFNNKHIVYFEPLYLSFIYFIIQFCSNEVLIFFKWKYICSCM
jgi:hypothetical protein